MIAFWFEPSASITYIRLEPSLLELKTILLPSEDQLGFQSAYGLLVRLIWVEPSAFITNISGAPSLRETNAILPPLGDQAGEVSEANRK